jgi:hypothetical protein
MDVTEAVQEWVSGKRENLGFVVRQLDLWDWQPERTVLEVRYEGEVKDPPAQVKDVRVFDQHGNHVSVLDSLLELKDLVHRSVI